MSTAAERGVRQWLCSAPRWALPVFSLVLGLVLATALWVGDQPGSWFVIGLFAAYAVFLYALAPRSEVIALMNGEARDERQRSINERATAFTGNALIWVLAGAFVLTTAIGSDLAVVFSLLCAFAGLTWLTALVVLTRRG